LKSNGLILTATLKVKTYGKIVALLGVCGRIGQNDTQKQQNTMRFTCEENNSKFKAQRFLLAKQLWQQSNNF